MAVIWTKIFSRMENSIIHRWRRANRRDGCNPRSGCDNPKAVALGKIFPVAWPNLFSKNEISFFRFNDGKSGIIITMERNARRHPVSSVLSLTLHVAVVILLFATAACCPGKRFMGDPESPYPPGTPAAMGEIVHLPTGMTVSPVQMTDVAGDARIVYFGETHDNPSSHRLELRILSALADLHPGRQALGMEMFSRSQQPVLDRWVAGKLDEKTFLRESRWYENWGMDYAYYRDLLNFARERRLPVIALNADRKQVKAVQNKPPDRLDAGEQEQLPTLDLADPYERAMVSAFFREHTHGGNDLDAFIRVQALWDETMARSVAGYLESESGRGMHLMVIAGGNHVSYGFGIPRRAFRRLPASYILIGGKEIGIPPDMRDRLMNVSLPRFPMVPYDFLVYLGYEKLPEGVRLGVVTEPRRKGPGLVVAKVLPGSEAERSGLKEGDILLAFDGAPLTDGLDLMYAVQGKRPGDRASLRVERQGLMLDVDILLRAAAKAGPPGNR